MKDYPHPTSAAASAVMRANRKKDTKPEIAIRRMLYAQGVRYRIHYMVRTGGISVKPDIVFLKARIAVFVDGCFWHSCPEHGNNPKANTGYWGPKLENNRRRDALVNEKLSKDGWIVLRIWEHVPPKEACKAILSALDSRPLRGRAKLKRRP